MTEKKNFLKQFWKNRKQIGSMTPSSRYLTKKMLENVTFRQAKVLVELGPGTGVFTNKILQRMSPDATLLVFELNDSFYADLVDKIRDPRVKFIHDSAEKINDYILEYQLEKADVVISSLPLAVFDDALRSSIIEATKKSLKEDGKFIQFQYTLQAKEELRSHYKHVSISFTALNLPPAFIYTCKKN